MKDLRRIFLSVGLLCISGSLFFKECLDVHLPDFLSGFLIGLGVVLVVGSQLKKFKTQ
jgi:hypothetical protein